MDTDILTRCYYLLGNRYELNSQICCRPRKYSQAVRAIMSLPYLMSLYFSSITANTEG